MRLEQKLPKQQKKYLSLGSNKEELLEFLSQDWSSNERHIRQTGEKEAFISVKAGAYKIYNCNNSLMCQPVHQISSNHEEADTKVFLAAKFALEIGCRDAVIFTIDSDVAILACYFAQMLEINLLVQIGSGKNCRVTDVKDHNLSDSIIQSLPSLHAFSGCDAVSPFHGTGKANWLSAIQKKEEYMYSLRLLGESPEVDDSVFNTIERLVCHLYGMPMEHRINNARYKKFSQGKTPDTQQLPPTHDELQRHVKRCNYQSYLWKQALLPNPDIPSPSGHGWLLRDNLLKIQWMENMSAPESVLETMVCECRKSTCGSMCQCQILGLECTDLCKCNVK